MRRWITACVAALMACGGEGSLEGPARVEVDTAELIFGEVPVGTTAQQRVVVRNVGGDDLNLLSVSLVDGDGATWRIAREPDESVVLGGTTLDVVVTFAPKVAGEEEVGRLQIRTSDTEAGPQFISLSGAGAPSTVDGDEDGYSPADGDCDDNRSETYPGAPELCDGRDNDCDGNTPSNEADSDGDNVRICGGDCDDGDRRVKPGAEEICDDKDSNCDGDIPDRADRDGDSASICDGDCDDDDASVWPGNPELCDGLDNDCSGRADDVDLDGDGSSACHGDCDDNDAAVRATAVDPTRNPAEPDGSDASPYTTLDAALADLDGICNTVFLFDADYTVALDLRGEQTVTLLGESRDGTVLRPDGAARQINLLDRVDLTLRSLTLRDGAGSGDGGALQSVFSDVTLDDVLLVGNKSGADGGALAVASGALHLSDVEARDNAAIDDGGAVAVFSGTLTIEDSRFEGNEGNRGGALLIEGTEVTASDSIFVGNAAKDTGGALQVLGSAAPTMERLDLIGNTAVNGGGAIALNEVASGGTLRNLAVMENNGGSVGGGISITGATASLTLANSTFTGNESSGQGAAIHVSATNASGVDLVGNIAAWSDGASGIWTSPTGGATVRYCLGFATSPGPDFGGGASVDGEGNQSDNPSFRTWSDNNDASDDVLTLRSASPAIDAGPPDPTWDDKDGSQNDVGVTGGPAAR